MKVTLPWTEDDVAALRLHYAAGDSVAVIAERLGRTRAAVRNKAYMLAITTVEGAWSDADLARLLQAYEGAPRKGELNLTALAAELGRTKQAICIKARKLGLTDIARGGVTKPKVDRRKYKTAAARSAAQSETLRQRHKETPHPMLGKKHSEEARKAISEKSQLSWQSKSLDERSEITAKSLRTRLANHGTLAPRHARGSWKAGWREIGGKRNYYRSRWEANWARYLEWLRERGEIKDWQHEPETFWFDAIKRGVRSYKPDFRVWANDGSSNLHEVKGYMCARSVTTLKRMAKYHPSETIKVIREKEYNATARTIGGLIEGWESGGRGDRP